MRRALPAIALSAAGVTWLLHAQGVIDSHPTTSQASNRPSVTGSATSPSDPTSPTTGAPGTDPPTGQRSPATNPSPSPAPSPSTPPSASAKRTVDGPTVDTRWGPVQVEVVIANHKIVDVRPLVYPNERDRSVAINNDALPLLRDEVIAAQSANVDTVSGATYTSEGYARSLQAALDSAGFRP